MRTFREALVLVVIAFACGGLAYFVHPKAPSFETIDLERDLAEIEILGEVLWVDARDRETYELARLEGALLLTEENWEEEFIGFLDRWTPDVATVVYCSSQTCARSRDVAERLREELGVENIYALKGGWDTLVEAGLAKEASQ